MHPKLFIAALFIGASACQTPSTSEARDHTSGNHTSRQSQNRPVTDLEQSVMAIHDGVMPQMSELMRLKKGVSAKMDQTADEAIRERGRQIGQQLTEADRAMMDWMHNYNGDTLNTLKPEQATQYLNAQKHAIEQVRDQMRQSITNASQFVKP